MAVNCMISFMTALAAVWVLMPSLIRYLKKVSFNQTVSEYSLEELRNMYGPEALNEALDYIKSLEEKETKKGNDFIPKAEINEQEVVENNGNSIEDTKKRRDREIY